MGTDRATAFAGLAEAAAQWLPEPVAQTWSAAGEVIAKAPSRAFVPAFAEPAKDA